MGLAAQGEFALLRTWSDAAVALLTLGLPQGLLTLQYRSAVSAAALQGLVWRCIAAVGLAMGLLVLVTGWLPLRGPVPWLVLAVLAAAQPLWVGQRLWRALALKATGVLPYALLTALPAWLILLGVLGLAALQRHDGFEFVLLLAALLSAAASAWMVRAWHGTREAWPRRQLWSVSLQSWLQALFAALLPAALLGSAKLLGGSLRDIGALSLGLQVYEVFAVLAAYAAPLLYDKAARLRPEASTQPLWAWVRRAGWPAAGLGLAAALVGPWLVSAVWPGLRGTEIAVSLMALSGLMALATRLAATTLLAQGRMKELSLQAMARLGVGLALLATLQPVVGPVMALPLALAGLELLTLWRLWRVWQPNRA